MEERHWEILAERMGTTGEELRILNDNLRDAERRAEEAEAALQEARQERDEWKRCAERRYRGSVAVSRERGELLAAVEKAEAELERAEQRHVERMAPAVERANDLEARLSATQSRVEELEVNCAGWQRTASRLYEALERLERTGTDFLVGHDPLHDEPRFSKALGQARDALDASHPTDTEEESNG